jgi:CheY-like chemotaxis protein
MVTHAPPTTLLLRAELELAQETFVSHTLTIAEDEITLAGFVPDLVVGAKVRLNLSFPKWLERIPISVRHLGSQSADGLGRPASMKFSITGMDPTDRRHLAALIAPRGAPEGSVRPTEYRCLLVEDNSFIRDMFFYAIEKYFRGQRTKVAMHHALDCEQAWTMLADESYDLAIVDHYLPTRTGSQLIARLRKEPRFSRLPVVAISMGGAEVREEAMRAGADLFLDKPIVLRDLFSTLDRLTPQESATGVASARGVTR